jgi:hypothetical protein
MRNPQKQDTSTTIEKQVNLCSYEIIALQDQELSKHTPRQACILWTTPGFMARPETQKTEFRFH